MRLPLHSLLASGRADDHPVCHDGQRFVMWPEFAARVAAHAAHFAQAPQVRWLLVDDEPQLFATRLLALLHAGKQVVIPPNTQPGTLQQLAGAFDAVAGNAPSGNSVRLAPVDPQTAIIDLYTSGSTGEPKRVRKTLAQFEAEIEALEALWGTTLGSAAILATAPHRHIYGLLFRLLWPLAAGRPFDCITCAHPDTLGERLALLGQPAAGALVSSPAQLSRLPALVALDSLTPAPKIIFSSGGPLPAHTATEFHRQLGQAPTEVFGSTETGGIAWRRQRGQKDSEVWAPLPGVKVDCGNDGALLLRSPFLADRCPGAPWRMDDAIERLADGRFRLLGRLDRIVKIEEKRLSLPGMEAQLLAHPWVGSAAAVALSGRRQSVGALVVLSAAGKRQLDAQGKREVAQQLRHHLAAHFEAVLLPRHWRFPEQLPIDARGKLTQAALAAAFATEPADDANQAAAPRLQPEVLAVRAADSGENQIVLDLHVPAALAHFPGHFPGQPILPGVVQIDWAVRYAREHLPPAGQFTALENVKFLALVLPDARVELTLKRDAAHTRLEFSFATSERKYSSGRIVFSAGSNA